MRRSLGLTHLMAIIAIVAVGLAMMKVANEWLARGIVLSTYFALLIATLGAVVYSGDRSGWIGYSILGWGHRLLVMTSSLGDKIFKGSDEARVDLATEILTARFHPTLPEPFRVANDPNQISDSEFDAKLDLYNARFRTSEYSRNIGVVIQGLVLALPGVAAGRSLSNRSSNTSIPLTPSLFD